MQHCEYPDHLATWAEFRRLLADEADQLSRGELRSNLESAARKLVSASKPVRELYDIETDPHELHNLIDDPNYQDVARRLENALDAWQSEYGDLGLQPEDDLLSSWQPDGRRPTVATPRVEQKPTGHATVRCDTPGARVGWTTDPPSADALTPDPFSQMLGIEPSEGRTWRPVTEALPLNQGLFLKAWRPGYEPSAEVAIEGSR